MSIALELYEQAFLQETGRTPRSEAYKRGVYDGLRYKAGEAPVPKEVMPYRLGSAECDAWFAGINEGYSRWRCHEEDEKPII